MCPKKIYGACGATSFPKNLKLEDEFENFGGSGGGRERGVSRFELAPPPPPWVRRKDRHSPPKNNHLIPIDAHYECQRKQGPFVSILAKMGRVASEDTLGLSKWQSQIKRVQS